LVQQIAKILHLKRDARSKTSDFDVIMMDDTSRFSRDNADTLQLHKELKYSGVRVICVSQSIDTDRDDSDMQVSMHALIDSRMSKNGERRPIAGSKAGSSRGRPPEGVAMAMTRSRWKVAGSVWW
jgi:DNA invertase Pin-like site-specific DNA recombinase